MYAFLYVFYFILCLLFIKLVIALYGFCMRMGRDVGVGPGTGLVYCVDREPFVHRLHVVPLLLFICKLPGCVWLLLTCLHGNCIKAYLRACLDQLPTY